MEKSYIPNFSDFLKEHYEVGDIETMNEAATNNTINESAVTDAITQFKKDNPDLFDKDKFDESIKKIKNFQESNKDIVGTDEWEIDFKNEFFSHFPEKTK